MILPRRLVAVTAAGVLAAAAALLSAVPASAAAPLSTIAGSAPSWLSRGTVAGTPSGSKAVHATIVLAPRGGLAAAQAFADEVSTPGSRSYRHFLTRSQYAARFDPTDATVAAIRTYVTGHGFTVDGVGADNGSVSISGTVAQADDAFAAGLRVWTHDGQRVVAPSKALAAPAAVAQVVLGVDGLDTTDPKFRPLFTNVPPPAGYRNSTLCSAGYGTKPATAAADGTALPKFGGKTIPYSVCGYTGAQLRTAYEKGSALTGSGVGVAVVDAYDSPTIASDAATYAARHGDPAYTAGQLTQSEPASYTSTGSSDCGASGWFGEQTLDVEAVHAMAPGASIHYYAAASCSNADLLAALTNAVNDPAVQVVSDSWGSASELLASTGSYEKVFTKAAAVGVSVLFSSGDDGDGQAAVGFKTVDYPASSPNVTAVGGTASDISESGVLTAQTGWGTNKYTLSSSGGSWTSAGYLYGAGGGHSTTFAKPSYQSSISGSGRKVPDVAMNADPTTGMLIGETQTFSDGAYYDEYRIGGTSLASPLFAGMVALAIQNDGGASAGFLNPTVYAHRTTAFTDVTTTFPDKADVRADYTNGESATGGYTYTARTFATDASLKVGKGYDPVTGEGVPNTAFLSILQ